jgi:hypothetical protein
MAAALPPKPGRPDLDAPPVTSYPSSNSKNTVLLPTFSGSPTSITYVEQAVPKLDRATIQRIKAAAIAALPADVQDNIKRLKRAGPTGFQHPSGLVSPAELAVMTDRLKKGQQPQATARKALITGNYYAFEANIAARKSFRGWVLPYGAPASGEILLVGPSYCCMTQLCTLIFMAVAPALLHCGGLESTSINVRHQTRHSFHHHCCSDVQASYSEPPAPTFSGCNSSNSSSSWLHQDRAPHALFLCWFCAGRTMLTYTVSHNLPHCCRLWRALPNRKGVNRLQWLHRPWQVSPSGCCCKPAQGGGAQLPAHRVRGA